MLNEKLFFKLNSTPIVTKYGNFIIDDIQNIERKTVGGAKTIKIPYTKFIKSPKSCWFCNVM